MGVIAGIGALLVVILALAGFVFSRISIAEQTEALVVSGSGGNDGAKVVKPGGRVFVMPVIQSVSEVSLEAHRVPISVNGVDKNKVPLSARGVVMVKVRADDSGIRGALERFGSDKEKMGERIGETMSEVLTGALRSALAEMTIEELLIKRETLSQRVRGTTDPEAAQMGLIIDSLQISDISDNNGYIKALGQAEDARAKAEARSKSAEQEKSARDKEIEAEQSIAERERDLEIAKAQMKIETDTAKAKADAAAGLAQAEQDKRLAILRQATAAEEATLRARQLETEVNKPADAEAYRLKTIAEAERDSRKSIADAEFFEVQKRGQAEAEVVKAKGLAEAEAMQKKAEAYREYGQAAVLEMLIERAPEIARELAAPMSNIDNLTVLSTEGASALPKTVANNFGQLDEVLKTFTGGTSLSDLARGLADKVELEDK